MADELISKQQVCEVLAQFAPESYTKLVEMLVVKLPAVDAVEVGSCEGCIYSHRKRPQKCSCCRRNRDLKDCYERREENDEP